MKITFVLILVRSSFQSFCQLKPEVMSFYLERHRLALYYETRVVPALRAKNDTLQAVVVELRNQIQAGEDEKKALNLRLQSQTLRTRAAQGDADMYQVRFRRARNGRNIAIGVSIGVSALLVYRAVK